MAARMAGVPSIVSTRHSLVAPPRRKVVELKYAVAAACCDWIVGICDATVKNQCGESKVLCISSEVQPQVLRLRWVQKTHPTTLRMTAFLLHELLSLDARSNQSPGGGNRVGDRMPCTACD